MRFSMLFRWLLTAAITCISGHAAGQTSVHRVFVISIDGMHAVDLGLFVRDHPDSALAYLVGSGYNYTSPSTPKPADSFPGLVALFTGGSPASTGIYLFRCYHRSLLPPTVPSWPTPPQGVFGETADLNSFALDGGGGLNENALPRAPEPRAAPA